LSLTVIIFLLLPLFPGDGNPSSKNTDAAAGMRTVPGTFT